MMEYNKFVLILEFLISVGFFSPNPLNDLTVNLNLNELPKGPKISSDELETDVKTDKTSGLAVLPSIELATVPCEERQKLDKPKRRKTRILHGTDVPSIPFVGEPPWLNWIVSIQAQVGRTQTGLAKYECCAGALVSRKHVLTALHCVAYFKALSSPTGLSTYIMQPVEPEKVDISVHSLEFLEGTEFGAEEIFYKNNSVILIALTRETIIVDDIALIRLDEEIPKNVSVNPISLPIRPLHDDDDYWMAGWGASETNPQWIFPENLKQFLQTKKDKANCLDIPNQLLRPIKKYLCFNRWNFNRPGITSQGTCSGDSGSPGVIFDKTLNQLKWYLQGIHASGQPSVPNGYPGCNEMHSYGVDMDVWHYKDDILEWMER